MSAARKKADAAVLPRPPFQEDKNLNRPTARSLNTHHRSRKLHHWQLRNTHARNIDPAPADKSQPDPLRG